MAVWFGHTQTLTSISKSVTTVASGILKLEANLATFMQKVGYYEKYFERMEPNLPVEVVTTASRLFARCYEYRAEIRDELESSLAYVADAGRWIVGMEDWNSKMEKRLAQISELVLLANTLLIEFAVTGSWGAQGSKDGLDAYLRHIAESVVLHNPTPPKKPRTARSSATNASGCDNPLFGGAAEVSSDSTSTSTPNSTTSGSETNYNPLFPAAVQVSARVDESPALSENEGELFMARSSLGSDPVEEGTGVAVSRGAAESTATPVADDDDDVLNPFARAYQPPVSVESSLASLRAESDNGSVYYNAVDSLQASVTSVAGSGGDEDVGDEPDSPVSLGEYECLEMDSIPQYVAFKPNALTRKRRLKQQFFGGPGNTTSPSASIESLASAQASQSSVYTDPSPKGSPRIKRVADPIKDRQRLMDLTYSYDFQRELNFNPFASPGMSTNLAAGPTPPQLDLSKVQRVPTVQEEEPMHEIKEQTFGHERLRPLEVPAEEAETDQNDLSAIMQIDSAEIDALGDESTVAAGAAVAISDDAPPISSVSCGVVVSGATSESTPPTLAQSGRLEDEKTFIGQINLAPSGKLEDAESSDEQSHLSLDDDDAHRASSPHAQIEGEVSDLSSSIGSDELSAVFYSAPDEFARLLHDDDTPSDRTS